MKEAEPMQQVDRTWVKVRGRKLTYFGGCDYFRLSSHPRVLHAVETGLRKYGLNVSASRRTSGNHIVYQQLERTLAKFFGGEAALLISGGYAADQVVTQSLAGEFTHALIDARSHLALLDAVRMLGCPVIKFKHQNAEDLAWHLKRLGKTARPMVLTDGLFAYNGSVAPLAAYLKVLPAKGLLVVDDAHGGGTIGRTGKGAVEVTGISRERVIQCLTLSKAFGVYGGALICSREMRATITARSHAFLGSTPLPLPLAYAATESLRVMKSDRALRRRLEGNVLFVKTALRAAGYKLPDVPGPMIPIEPSTPRATNQLKRALLAAEILPPYILYPAGSTRGYFRFVISSEHTPQQLSNLVKVLTTTSR